MIPIPYEKDGLSGWHVWSASKDRLINVYFVPSNYDELVLEEIGGLEEFFVASNIMSLTQSMRANKKKGMFSSSWREFFVFHFSLYCLGSNVL
jgi:hypothetical protein